MSNKSKTGQNLRKFLFNTLEEVTDGKTTIQEANTIIGAARQVNSSARIDLEYSRLVANNRSIDAMDLT